jgi:hypothetical protein
VCVDCHIFESAFHLNVLECQFKFLKQDAMSDAIEGAAVMLYGVSLAYKESVNCRLEASYAIQQVSCCGTCVAAS